MSQEIILAQMMALAAQAAAAGEDMNEGVVGGSAAPMPIGIAQARCIQIVELGEHSQKDFATKKHKGFSPEISIGFALWGFGRDQKTGEQVTFHNPDTNAPRIFTMFDMPLSRNTGSRAFKLFKVMNWRGDKVNFAQFLNQTFLLPFTLQNKSKTDTTQVVKLNPDGIAAPINPMDQQLYAIPEVPVSDLKLFLWDFPSKAAWDSLFVEGEWPAKGDKPAESKNKLQNKILAANNYQGSPLQILLAGGGAALPDLSAPTAPVAAPVAPVAVAPAAAVVPPVAVPLAVPVQPVVAAPVQPAVLPVATAPIAAPVSTSPSSPVLPV